MGPHEAGWRQSSQSFRAHAHKHRAEHEGVDEQRQRGSYMSQYTRRIVVSDVLFELTPELVAALREVRDVRGRR